MPTEAPPAPAAPQTTTTQPTSEALPVNTLPIPTDAPAPKKGSAMESIFDRLDGKKPATAAKPKPAPAPDAQVDETPPETGNSPTDQPEETPETPAKPEETPKSGAKPGKKSVWRLVDDWKARATEAERKLSEATMAGSALPEQEKGQYLDQIKSLETRNAELEKEVQFVNYQQSDEFQKQYQKPYEQSLERALSELKEIPATDPNTGEARYANFNDLMALVQMPLGQAQKIANEWFGDFSSTVMGHRKEIKDHLSRQTSALKEAREKGLEHRRLQMEQMTKAQRETVEFLNKEWSAANEEARSLEHVGRFFSQVEGDDEINSRLERGFKLVDEAFSKNPSDPSLTPDERKEIVRKHAAVRNRAAAFGRLAYENAKLEKELNSLKKELKQFKDTEPPASGGTAPGRQNGQRMSARDSMFSRIEQVGG